MSSISRKKKLNWGVAGCGKFAETAFIPTITLLRKSTVASVFSNTQSRAKSIADKFGISGVYSNYSDFLKSEIDAVYIGSANLHHFEQVIKAAEAGKHILCEKPLAVTSKQAEEMVKACEANGVQISVNYSYRFHPLIIKTKELLENQYLGKLVSINLNFNIDFAPGNNFRYNKDLSGGGAIRDLGTHMIDLLRLFGGEIKSIDGVVENIVYKGEVDDFAAALVTFEKSGFGYFNVSFNVKKAFNRIEILGHKGAISIEGLIGNKHASSKVTILLEGEAKKTFRKRGNKQLGLIKSVQNSFLKNEVPQITGNDGLINMRIMEELENKCRLKGN